MSDETGVEGELHGRRSVIKKAAVAGAVAWTAPTVLSVSAGAQDSPDCEGNCLGIVVGNSAVWSTGQTWVVPLSLGAACPTCSTNPSVSNLTNLSAPVNTAAVQLTTTQLRVIVDFCDQPVSVDVQFDATVTCNGVTSTCCVHIAFGLTPGTPTLPNICDDFTVNGGFIGTVSANACPPVQP